MRLDKFHDWLVHPALRSLDVDGSDFSLAHRRILNGKFMLRQLFDRFYRECRFLDEQFFRNCPGKRLEIGSGSSFIKETYPDVITSDFKHLPFVDIVQRAERMPFLNESLRAIYAINVFHHFPRPREFFHEILRVLHPGGGVIMIEPYGGCVGRWLFKNLHQSEGYDAGVSTWEAPTATGPFSLANQALSQIVFQRDRLQFEAEFPELVLLLDRPHTHLWYLLSGGVNFRQLAPDFFTPLIKCAEWALAPFNRWIALQHTIVLRKVESLPLRSR